MRQHAQQKSSPDGRPASLRIDVGFVLSRGTGRCPEFVKRILTEEVSHLEINHAKVASWTRRQTRFFCEVAGGWDFSTGSLARVEQGARAQGIHLEIRDDRPKCVPCVPAGQAFLEDLSGRAREFAELLIEHHSGQIEVHKPQDIVESLDIFAGLYLASRMLLIAANKSEANSIRSRLMCLRPGTKKAVPVPTGDEGRIAVACTADLVKLNPAHYDAFFYLRTETLLQASARLPFEINFGSQRRFVFTSCDDRLQRREWLRVESATGPLICSLPGTGAQPTQVTVAFADLPSTSLPDNGQSGQLMKRMAVWTNTNRNRQIGLLAHSLACRNSSALDAYRVPLELIPVDPWITILVETQTHAEALRNVLAALGLSSTALFIPGTRSLLRVATFVEARKGWDWQRWSIVIRADGGVGPLEGIGFPPSQRNMRGAGSLLVDLDEHSSHDAVRATVDRHRTYESQGFHIARAPQRALKTTTSLTNQRPLRGR